MNPIAFMYLMLGLFGVIALAMCAGAAAGLRDGTPYRRHRQPRTLPGLGMVRRVSLRRAWLAFEKHLAPGLAQVRNLKQTARKLAGTARTYKPTWTRQAIAAQIAVIPPTPPDMFLPAPIDAATVTRRAAQYRQAMTDAERWPGLQPQWSDSTGEFAALIDATGGA